jgi:hypothetical protein
MDGDVYRCDRPCEKKPQQTMTQPSSSIPMDSILPAARPVRRLPIGAEPLYTDSGDVARSFRDHVARCSDMMSPA